MATVQTTCNVRLATKKAAMDACIARGGISHVLSQARASLKNPSRPYTPQTSGRPLFQGDDYRPGSRPSSSYTVAELKQMAQQQKHHKSAPSVPKVATKIPLRPNGMHARPPTTPQPEEVKDVDVTASSSNLKLIHAPILLDDESEDELLEGSTGRTDVLETSGAKFDPEASLTLPSNDELLQSYNEIKRCMQDLLDQTESSDWIAGVVRLREMVNNFVGLSSFLQVGSTQKSTENAATTKLCFKLFDKLSRVVLEKWATIAACVLELVPALLDLYGAIGTDRESMNIQMIKLGKTLFVFSKDSCNDEYFCNVRYIEAILHAIAETSSQASRQQDEIFLSDNDSAKFLSPEQHGIPLKMLIYAAGTLKNISSADDKMARLLASNRAIAILSETMLWRAEDAPKNKEIAQFLIQTTGILRNLSILKNTQKQFLEARIPSRLCGMIPAFIEHQELMVNISRILSKLTLHELPRAQINQSSTNMENLMVLVDHRQNSWLSLVDQQRADMRFQGLLFIRVFFVLGNLCAGNDQNRLLIATHFSGISPLLEVLQFYGSRYFDSRHSTSNADTIEKEERRRTSEAEQSMEVLIKLIRVIANLAINAEVGAKLNENEGLMPLLEILEVAQRAGDEELMLNALSCITNVSYYSNAPTGDTKPKSKSNDVCFIESNRVAITQLLSRILLDRNEEAVVEAARAFGNLSRFKDVLVHMGELKVLDCFVVLLDHSNREVVYTVCGVLMNAALDQSTRQALLLVRPEVNDDTVEVRTLLVGIVECAAGDDLEMTLIASKALYNLMLISSTSSHGATSFSCDVMNLRRTIEEVLSTIRHQETKRGSREEAGEPNEDHNNEEGSEAWGNRQELRSVLLQLRKSIDSLI